MYRLGRNRTLPAPTQAPGSPGSDHVGSFPNHRSPLQSRNGQKTEDTLHDSVGLLFLGWSQAAKISPRFDTQVQFTYKKSMQNAIYLIPNPIFALPLQDV
jgi:hypothetical protein